MPRALGAGDLLEVWEAGEDQDPVERALTLLRAIEPDRDEAGTVPVPERDARILALRVAAFGPRLEGFAVCPSCGERLEFALTVDPGALRIAEAPSRAVTADGRELQLRLPDSDDLHAAAALGDRARARRLLAARCARDDTLSPDAVEAIAQRMGEIAEPAEIRIDLACPACGHAWQSTLDIAAFVWSELRAEAHRLLGEVDALARAYAWSETTVLALSPRRRRHYLELALA
jgi:uncharacterized protein (UPF0212 family)